MGELLRLHQQRLAVKVVVFNNGALAFVELEMKAGGMITYGTDLVNPSRGQGAAIEPVGSRRCTASRSRS